MHLLARKPHSQRKNGNGPELWANSMKNKCIYSWKQNKTKNLNITILVLNLKYVEMASRTSFLRNQSCKGKKTLWGNVHHVFFKYFKPIFLVYIMKFYKLIIAIDFQILIPLLIPCNILKAQSKFYRTIEVLLYLHIPEVQVFCEIQLIWYRNIIRQVIRVW